MAIGWKINKDCPLCGTAIAGEFDAPDLPTASFPGLGKPHGDFLAADDPLQPLCGKRIHRRCLETWPERPRFVGAYLDWMVRRLREDPERGTAYADEALLVSAPGDPAEPDAQILVLDLAYGTTTRVRPSEWSEWVERHPLETRFPTPEALVAAIDWGSKDTSCRICMNLLGVNPFSPAAHRLPVSEAWTILDPARPMRQYLGTWVHTECYASWPKRPLFAATLTDIRHRLARLSAQGCPWSDAQVLVLLERGGPIELTLRATGTTVAIPRDGWAAWDPPAFLRPFDRESMLAALPEVRAKFPSTEALEGAVDWGAREAERGKAEEAFLVELRALPIRARREGVRCPRCGRRVGDLELSEAERAAGCPSCGAALTPLDFGWLP
ncbi:MAG TPA: hypothetical protein VJB14_17000 [Planctomycetota bacterium]|nr:hypothetical protein [Planctomycetota bacterium]